MSNFQFSGFGGMPAQRLATIHCPSGIAIGSNGIPVRVQHNIHVFDRPIIEVDPRGHVAFVAEGVRHVPSYLEYTTAPSVSVAHPVRRVAWADPVAVTREPVVTRESTVFRRETSTRDPVVVRRETVTRETVTRETVTRVNTIPMFCPNCYRRNSQSDCFSSCPTCGYAYNGTRGNTRSTTSAERNRALGLFDAGYRNGGGTVSYDSDTEYCDL